MLLLNYESVSMPSFLRSLEESSTLRSHDDEPIPSDEGINFLGLESFTDSE